MRKAHKQPERERHGGKFNITKYRVPILSYCGTAGSLTKVLHDTKGYGRRMEGNEREIRRVYIIGKERDVCVFPAVEKYRRKKSLISNRAAAAARTNRREEEEEVEKKKTFRLFN